MAVSVASFNDGLLVHGSRRPGIQPRKTGTDDGRPYSGLKARISALVGYWEGVKDRNAPRRCFNGSESWQTSRNPRNGNTFDLFKEYGTAKPPAVPPPTYEESLQDLPPDYTTTEALAAFQLPQDVKDSVGEILTNLKLYPSTGDAHDKIDVSEIEGIRSYGGKKAKQAAKKAQQAKWADSDNEEGNGEGADGGAGGDDNGGGDDGAGAGAGGDGGDPPGGGDGGDGGDGDIWDTGSKKKDKKKKKKNAWLVVSMCNVH